MLGSNRGVWPAALITFIATLLGIGPFMRRRACPNCAGEIGDTDTVCPHCGKTLVGGWGPARSPAGERREPLVSSGLACRPK